MWMVEKMLKSVPCRMFHSNSNSTSTSTKIKTVPILPCTSSPTHLIFQPSPPPAHPLQSPTLDLGSIPPSTLLNLQTASEHLHKERLVAIPTETVYGLAASTASPKACKRVYALKGRPSDNPLIVHVSSLDMLATLTPPGYTPSPIQMALISHFWPGPLTLLFPARNPVAPPPAPQTVAVRFPAHPTARVLISLSGLPVSAPSANRSGRPSPTSAGGVWRDLGVEGVKPDHDDPEGKGKDGDGQGVLGCILDAGPCSVGLESTVVDATSWTYDPAQGAVGGTVKVLRPGGVGVEEIEEVCQRLDEELGGGVRTRVWVYGRDKDEPEPKPEVETETGVDGSEARVEPGVERKTQTVTIPETQVHHLPEAATKHNKTSAREGAGEISNPSTPGMKYKHYSPSVPVYLVYPSDVFTTTTTTTTTTATNEGNREGNATNAGSRTVLFINKVPYGKGGRSGQSLESGHVNNGGNGSGTFGEKGEDVKDVLRKIANSAGAARGKEGNQVRLGVMAFEDSPLRRKIQQAQSQAGTGWGVEIEFLSLGRTVEDAARRLFGGMLALEGKRPESQVGAEGAAATPEAVMTQERDGVDAIVIEATNTYGLGLAFMERAGKAVGGGGGGKGLGQSVAASGEVKRFLVDVE